MIQDDNWKVKRKFLVKIGQKIKSLKNINSKTIIMICNLIKNLSNDFNESNLIILIQYIDILKYLTTQSNHEYLLRTTCLFYIKKTLEKKYQSKILEVLK